MNFGFALSGGGARGIAHLGVLQALDETGIRPSAISGTSSGAIVGAFYASGFSPKETLEIITKTNFFKLLKPALSFTGLLSMDGLVSVFKEYLKDDFSSLSMPLTISATDLNKGRTAYFSEGELIRPILAASCIPVIFKPVEIDGHNYVDGGILNNLPVEPLIGKYDKIIGVHTNPIYNQFEATNAKAIVERSLLMAISGNTIRRSEKCDFYIEPPELGKFGGMDIKKAKELFEIGYSYTKENIDNFGFVKI